MDDPTSPLRTPLPPRRPSVRVGPRALSRLTGTFSAQFNELLVVKFLDSMHVMYFTVINLLKAELPLRVQNLQVKKLTPSKARKV